MTILDDEKPELTRRQKWMKRILVFLFVIGLLFSMGLLMMSFLSGQNESLKLGIQDYMSEATGMKAEIGAFNYMSLFPVINFDGGDITFVKEGAAQPSIKIDSIKYQQSFWDLFLNRTRFNMIDISGLHVDAGVYTKEAISIDSAGFQKSGQEGELSGFVAKGHYGQEELSLMIGMAYDRKGEKDFYKISGDDLPVKLVSPFLTVDGKMEKTRLSGTTIKISSLGFPDKVLSGEINVSGFFTNKIEGKLETENSHISFDLEHTDRTWMGDIEGGDFALKDAGIWGQFQNVLNVISLSPKEEKSFFDPDSHIDIDVEIKKLIFKGEDVGKIKFPLKLEKQKLSFGPFSGVISQGRLAGQAFVHETKGGLEMNVDLSVKDWAYEPWQDTIYDAEEARGTARVKISSKTESKDFRLLQQNINGEVIVIGGRGRFESHMMNLWGKGLVNILLPSFTNDDEINLNCMIADFKIEDGMAKADPFLMDTKRVKIVGKGDIDIPAQTIDFRLKPEPKGVNILNLPTAVKIEGPLFTPDISADTLSLGLGLGKLLLGTVNPALMVVTMTDLGITGNHPCAEYVEGQSVPETQGAPRETPE